MEIVGRVALISPSTSCFDTQNQDWLLRLNDVKKALNGVIFLSCGSVLRTNGVSPLIDRGRRAFKAIVKVVFFGCHYRLLVVTKFIRPHPLLNDNDDVVHGGPVCR